MLVPVTYVKASKGNRFASRWRHPLLGGSEGKMSGVTPEEERNSGGGGRGKSSGELTVGQMSSLPPPPSSPLLTSLPGPYFSLIFSLPLSPPFFSHFCFLSRPLLTPSLVSSLPQGWKWHSPACYWVGEDLLTFDEARKSCEDHSATLVTIANRCAYSNSMETSIIIIIILLS